jgi:orotate phosphoribosyltransferase
MSESNDLTRLLAELSYKRGTFTLASGKTSDFYVDVKQTVFTARGARLVGEVLCDRLQAAGIELVGGMAVGAIPLVDAALNEAARRGYELDGFFVRKDVKQHGTGVKLDGRFRTGVKTALLEDVVTTGESTIKAIDAVEGAGGRVDLVVVVVDREEDGGLAKLASRGGEVEALATKTAIRATADTV